MFGFSIPTRPRFSVLLLIAVMGVTSACDDDGTDVGASAEVTVMTRNVYLGADIFRITTASSPQELPVIAAQIFGIMEANDFRARAGALATEIEEANPHLVGLQEVEMYRIQDPSDYIMGNTSVNATEVHIDFLAVLLDSLDARGLSYSVASQVENADVELPAARSASEFFDIRMTDRDVILARSDVNTGNAGAAGFGVTVPFELASGDTIWFERGYTWVDASVDGADLVFVNTHLEVSSGGQLAFIQTAQANQLINQFGTTAPVVLVGDFNTEPGESPYGVLTSTFTDAWTELGTGGEGLTCCHPEMLFESRDLYSRIDLILYQGDIDVLSAEVVGDDPADRTSGGLWPSDHAGVVATLRITD